jgi:hypothetical protein
MKKALVLALLIISMSMMGAIHAQTAPANWTIMHYTAVDNDLEGAAFNDYYEMQSIGSGEGVNIVAQLDRAEGFESRFGDWTDTRRFFIQQVPPQPAPDMAAIRAAVVDYLVAAGAGDAESLTQQAAQAPDDVLRNLYEANNLGVTFEQTPVQELGELDMGDPQSLVDFIEWSVQNYPAEHYMLIIGSHGGGWRGIGPDNGGAQPSMLDLPEIDAALTTARENLGLDKLDIIGFDACLMAVTDVAAMLEPHADYVLFSQEVIPSNGWEYFNSISAMQQNSDWDAFQVGSAFVDSYMEYYAGQGARTKVGLSLVDTAALPNLRESLANFAAVVSADTAEVLSALGTARNNSQIFGASLGDGGEHYSYIDLRDFMNWFSLQPTITEDEYFAALEVIAAYDAAVPYSQADSRLPRAYGLSVYLPSTAGTYDATYPTMAPETMTFWDQYLTGFYDTVATALDGSSLQLEITDVFTLGGVGSFVDNPVVFFDAGGQGVVNLAYTISYVAEDGTYMVVDTSPISYNTILPTGELLIEYPSELTPSTFNWSVEFPFISDGTNRALSLLQTSNAGNELSVSGTYVTPQGSQPAVLVFDAETRTYSGLLASDGVTVYQAAPNPGDQFIVDLVSISPDGEVFTQPQTDTPLTFGLEPFSLFLLPAVSGDYSIHLTMTDLAGNTISRRTDLAINNDTIDGTVRGYTDTNEGIHFEYPFNWGESYSYTNEDGSLTNAVSDADGTQNVYVDVFYETDAASALESILNMTDGVVSDVTETTFGGVPAVTATIVSETDDGTLTSVVIALANEPGASVVVFTFAGVGQDVQPDPAVIQWLGATLEFFPPLLD